MGLSKDVDIIRLEKVSALKGLFFSVLFYLLFSSDIPLENALSA